MFKCHNHLCMNFNIVAFLSMLFEAPYKLKYYDIKIVNSKLLISCINRETVSDNINARGITDSFFIIVCKQNINSIYIIK